MSQKKPLGFRNAEGKAEKVLSNKEKLKATLTAAIAKAFNQKEKLKSVWDDFQTLFRLINAWLKKEYTEVPWKTILYAVTAVIYFLNPLDLVPDYIPITGLIDDISIIGFVINSIKKDLNLFLDWEKKQNIEETDV